MTVQSRNLTTAPEPWSDFDPSPSGYLPDSRPGPSLMSHRQALPLPLLLVQKRQERYFEGGLLLRCDMNPEQHPTRQNSFRAKGCLLYLVLNALAGQKMRVAQFPTLLTSFNSVLLHMPTRSWLGSFSPPAAKRDQASISDQTHAWAESCLIVTHTRTWDELAAGRGCLLCEAVPGSSPFPR